MVIRTFFDRNNTIIYNDLTNTGKNPVAELFYGGSVGDETYSRFLFHFDENRLRELYANHTLCDLSKLTHKIKMTNTGSFDTDLLGKSTCGGKDRACSFDLILFQINQDWDEGNGYDFGSCAFLSPSSASIATCPSNWADAQTNIPWSEYGTYSGSSSAVTITSQHFEEGNENLEMDVTEIVNGIITGDTNYGFGIGFPSNLEALATDDLQYVGFFTRHTQTFYEPFLESVYDNPIRDDRANFYMDKVNKLYLYSNIGGEPTSLDNLPELTITDAFGDVITTYSSDTLNCSGTTLTGSVVSNVTCVSKGVYSADVFIPSSAYPEGDCTDFTDTWSNICINGVKRPDVELDFIIKDPSGYYNIGNNDELPKKYGFKVTGIKQDESIKRGDVRRVNVTAKIPYTINQSEIIDNLEYRLYVKEGQNQFTVIDFQDVNRAFNSNYFYIDTASLIPNKYYIDVKVKSHNEVTTLSEALSFNIVSQSESRISQ
jgi:hypothetical protein